MLDPYLDADIQHNPASMGMGVFQEGENKPHERRPSFRGLAPGRGAGAGCPGPRRGNRGKRHWAVAASGLTSQGVAGQAMNWPRAGLRAHFPVASRLLDPAATDGNEGTLIDLP